MCFSPLQVFLRGLHSIFILLRHAGSKLVGHAVRVPSNQLLVQAVGHCHALPVPATLSCVEFLVEMKPYCHASPWCQCFGIPPRKNFNFRTIQATFRKAKPPGHSKDRLPWLHLFMKIERIQFQKDLHGCFWACPHCSTCADASQSFCNPLAVVLNSILSTQIIPSYCSVCTTSTFGVHPIFSQNGLISRQNPCNCPKYDRVVFGVL